MLECGDFWRYLQQKINDTIMKKVGTWMAAAIIVVGIAAIVSLFVEGDTERTDDAQIDQYVSPVNVRVAGYVREIQFTEHSPVRQGDTLLIIDDSEYRIHLKQAEAALLEARGGKQVATISVGTVIAQQSSRFSSY